MQSAMSNGGITSPLNNILRKTINPWYDDNPNVIAGSAWPQYLKNAMVITPPRTHTTPAGGLTSGTPIVIMPKNSGAIILPSFVMVGSPSASVSNPSLRIGYAGNQCLEFSPGGSHMAYFASGTAAGTKLSNACKYHARSDGLYGFSPTSSGQTLADSDTAIFRPAAGIIGVYNPSSTTTAQAFEVYNTYTSSTSFENIRVKAVSGNAYQIGSAVGSAGGSNRDISLGYWDSAGTFTNRFYITVSGNAGINPGSVGYLRDIFQVNTTSTSTIFGSGSIAPQGITITNSTNQINRPIGLQFSGYEGWGFGGIYGTMTSSGGNTYGRISIVLRSASGGSYTEVCRWDENSCFSLTPWISTSGSITGFVYTDAANTGQTASTEATSVNFNLSSTKQFATGALTTQRAFRVQAPTYSFVGASTITTASTLSISGPPVAGTNATITNAYALNIESGRSFLQGGLIAYGDVELGGNTTLISQSGAFTATYGSAFFGWTEGGYITYGTPASSVVTRLYRDAAGVIAQRNGTNAQIFRVYNTYTSSTSYEACVLDWQTESNVLCFGTIKGSGGGSARQLKIVTDGTAALTISTAQAITASSTLTAVGTITSQGSISNDRYAATPLIRVRRAGGTSSSPTQVTTAQTIGIIGSYGYHDGGAFHSNTGASIQFVSTEAYTSTAQGTEIRFATAEAGAASASTRLTIEDNGVSSFQKLIGQETEVTGTPTATTQTLTLNDGNHQTLALTSSTGNVTVTLTVPDRSSAGTIIVKQHGTIPRDITWASSGTIKWMGTEPTWNGDSANAVRIVSWRWNGSVIYLSATDVAI